jgi:hypothetical protein
MENKKMKNNIGKILVSTLLILSMIMPMFAFAPTSAKNLNWSSDVYKIDYYNAGGDADFVLPTPLPTNYPNFPEMRLRAVHVEMPNADLDYNTLLVFLYDPIKAAAGKNPWQPYAEITDANDEVAAFERIFWMGSYLEFDATIYKYTSGPNTGQPLPAILSADNVIVVDKGVLSINRNGNNLLVTLNSEQTIKKALATGPTAYFELPAFSLETTSEGYAMHTSDTAIMLGWLGATGYTIVHDDLRFDGNGVFTSEDTFLEGMTTINANVIMHGTHTFYNP